MLLREHDALAKQGFLENDLVELADSPSSLAGQTLGVYRLVSQIGQGGMGTVWLAERIDGRFERRVAVKFCTSRSWVREEKSDSNVRAR